MNESIEVIDQTIIESASKGEWVPVIAFVTWLLVAAIKSDRFPVDIPPRARPIVAVVLAQVLASAQAIMGGISWRGAVLSGVVAAALAIAGQELGSSTKSGATKSPLPPPTAILLLALLGGAPVVSGCGLSPRHIAAESALGLTDVLEEAEPQLRSQCLLPYAYAVKVDDRASMASIDKECAPKIAAYDGARSLVVATRLALSLDDIDALKRLGPELVAAGQRLLALIGGAK